MLIEFSISNFRSFREKQTFSMVAAPRLHKRENLYKPKVKGEKIPDLLKVAAIYGPNASGKSNLIKALEIVGKIASRQPSNKINPLPVAPFRFDPLLADQPTRVQVHFISKEQRYEFELAATPERIVEERLVAFPNGKETLLYERRHLSSGDVYTLGEQLEGEQALHDVWKKLTGSQVLFIAQAVANSSEDLKQLKAPFEWLTMGTQIVHDDMRPWARDVQNIAIKYPHFVSDIPLFLQEIDVPIIKIELEPNIDSDISIETENDEVDVLSPEDSNANTKTILTHKTALGEASFGFDEESGGTKNLIGFWLPWRTTMINNEKYGSRTLVVDELDSSLHPEIVAALVKKHIQCSTHSQLIFTTHDTHLMDTKLLRRDQFWLTERDTNGATRLRSIHDFEGRQSEDLEKRYYEGRYRSLPILHKG